MRLPQRVMTTDGQMRNRLQVWSRGGMDASAKGRWKDSWKDSWKEEINDGREEDGPERRGCGLISMSLNHLASSPKPFVGRRLLAVESQMAFCGLQVKQAPAAQTYSSRSPVPPTALVQKSDPSP